MGVDDQALSATGTGYQASDLESGLARFFTNEMTH